MNKEDVIAYVNLNIEKTIRELKMTDCIFASDKDKSKLKQIEFQLVGIQSILKSMSEKTT